MRTKSLLLVLALVFVPLSLSADEDSRPHSGTVRHQVISGVVHDATVAGDRVTIHLYREPYDVVTVKWQRVQASEADSDQPLYAPDLRNQDNVEVTGDFDRDGRVFTVRHIKLTSRIKHLGAPSR